MSQIGIGCLEMRAQDESGDLVDCKLRTDKTIDQVIKLALIGCQCRPVTVQLSQQLFYGFTQ
jgi:hypothetical protein